MVEKIYEKGWAYDQPIEEGDILKLVNGGKPEHHSTISLFNRVEKARFHYHFRQKLKHQNLFYYK